MIYNLPIRSIIERVLVIFLIVVSPLLVAGSYLSVYEYPKFLFISILAAFLMLFLLFSRKQRIGINLIILIGISVFIGLLNLKTSIMPYRSFAGDTILTDSIIALGIYLSVIIYFYFTKLSKTEIFKYITLSGSILAILTILHFFALHFGITEVAYDGRVTATIGQPNILGGILVGIVPISYFLIGKNKSKLFIISTVLITCGLVLTMSRGALIALLLFIAIEIGSKIKDRPFRILYIISLLSLPIIIIYLPSIDTNNTDLPYLAQRFLSFKDESILYDLRFEIWKNAGTFMRERPIMGWGNGTFQELYPMNISKESAPKSIFMEVESSHNFIIDLISEWGLIGITFFISFFAYITVGKGNRYMKLALLLILVRSLFNVNSVYIFLLVSIYVGLLFKEKSLIKIPKIFYKPFILLILIVTSILCMFVYRIGISEKYEKMASKEGDVSKVVEYYEQAMNANPYKISLRNKYIALLYWNNDDKLYDELVYSIDKFNDYKSNMYLGLYYLQHDENKAIKYLTIAESMNKREPKIYHYLGMLYYKKANYEDSYTSFMKTIELDKKNFSDDYVYLGQIELINGNIDKAKDFTKLAAPSHNKNVLLNEIDRLE